MERDPSCIFCKIASHELPANIVHEDDDVVAFLSIQPVSEGHTIVIPREHSAVLDQASPEAAAKLFAAVHRLGPAITEAAGGIAHNIGVNCGAAAGQLVGHTHVHIIPRSPNDGLVEWRHLEVTPEQLAATAAKIRASLA